MEDVYTPIKQIIEDFEADLAPLLAEEDASAYQLELALSHLERAKEFTLNSEKINFATYLMNEAINIAIPNIITVNIATALGLPKTDIHPGAYKIYDEQKNHIGHVPILWTVKILNPFAPPALLLILVKDQDFYGGFGVGTSNSGLAISYEVIKFKSKWIEPIWHNLQSFKLFEWKGKRLTTGSIHYQIQIQTPFSNVHLDIHQQYSGSFTTLEKALFQLASKVATSAKNSPLSEYLDFWDNDIIQ